MGNRTRAKAGRARRGHPTKPQSLPLVDSEHHGTGEGSSTVASSATQHIPFRGRERAEPGAPQQPSPLVQPTHPAQSQPVLKLTPIKHKLSSNTALYLCSGSTTAREGDDTIKKELHGVVFEPVNNLISVLKLDEESIPESSKSHIGDVMAYLQELGMIETYDDEHEVAPEDGVTGKRAKRRKKVTQKGQQKPSGSARASSTSPAGSKNVRVVVKNMDLSCSAFSGEFTKLLGTIQGYFEAIITRPSLSATVGSSSAGYPAHDQQQHRSWKLTRSTRLQASRTKSHRCPDFILLLRDCPSSLPATSIMPSSMAPPPTPSTVDNPNPEAQSRPPSTGKEVITWDKVLIVGEHHSTGESHSDNVNKLAFYASEVFASQPLRQYVFGLRTENSLPLAVSLWLYDRCGAVASKLINLATEEGITELVCMVWHFANGDRGIFGFDLSFVPHVPQGAPAESGSEDTNLDRRIFTSPLGLYVKILMTDKDPETATWTVVTRVQCRRPGIASRGTTCLEVALVSDVTKRKYILKDSWPFNFSDADATKTHIPSETSILRYLSTNRLDTEDAKANGINIPRFHSSVQIKGVLEDIRHHTLLDYGVKKERAEKHLKERKLTRILMDPAGSSLNDAVVGPLELLSTVLGAFLTHKRLYFEHGILHRDISTGNIMTGKSKNQEIVHEGEGTRDPPSPATGMLIDYDNSIFYPSYTRATEVQKQDNSETQGKSQNDLRAPNRTGTTPFMACAILEGPIGAGGAPAIPHRYSHDLESFLYVLIWVCCYNPRRLAAPTHGHHEIQSMKQAPASSSKQATTSNQDGASSRLRIPPEDPLREWTEGHTISSNKATHMTSTRYFQFILAAFAPPFNIPPIQNAISAYRRVLFLTSCPGILNSSSWVDFDYHFQEDAGGDDDDVLYSYKLPLNKRYTAAEKGGGIVSVPAEKVGECKLLVRVGLNEMQAADLIEGILRRAVEEVKAWSVPETVSSADPASQSQCHDIDNLAPAPPTTTEKSSPTPSPGVKRRWRNNPGSDSTPTGTTHQEPSLNDNNNDTPAASVKRRRRNAHGGSLRRDK